MRKTDAKLLRLREPQLASSRGEEAANVLRIGKDMRQEKPTPSCCARESRDKLRRVEGKRDMRMIARKTDAKLLRSKEPQITGKDMRTTATEHAARLVLEHGHRLVGLVPAVGSSPFSLIRRIRGPSAKTSALQIITI